MTEQTSGSVQRRAARAILIDDQGCLLLLKRTKPDEPPYWTSPGGGVEESDESVEAALHRELAEELGATAVVSSQVFLFSYAGEDGDVVHHFFAARLSALDASTRTGAEFSDPARGGYELDRVALRGDALAGVDLKPAPLKEFVLANRAALLTEAASAV
ncbi:NUDIX hydrolase [Streptomonospora alba]|uniref:NUDIX hydrolase n=1 Tax=Streptomonospora alba TaxID=183763 RepID=A0A0C2JDT9_9ACTN|nr:NUDIX hydrolase [Streptomonospora alba]KIH99551.1 NUDIX hydrolase [Streptomonospora alba]